MNSSTFRLSALIALFALGCMSPLSLAGQTTPVPSSLTAETQYPNTKDGLRTFLEDIRSAAMRNEEQKIADLVKQTEIPDYQNWFHKTYPADKAESWSKPYGQELGRNEQSFQMLFARLSRTDGQILVRKVNDEPEPGQGLEWGMLHSARTPLDIYFASWKSESPNDMHTEGIGYFIFIDGMFRWNSTIYPIVPKIEKAEFLPAKGCPTKEASFSGPVYHVGSGVTPPKLITMHQLRYTKEARKAGIEGTVLLSAIIDIDGRAKNIQVVRGLGYGLDEQAIAVLSCAKFEPARFSDKLVPVKIAIEQNFHLSGR